MYVCQEWNGGWCQGGMTFQAQRRAYRKAKTERNRDREDARSTGV